MKSELNSIIFEITQDCNLNCKYCYNIWKADSNLAITAKQSYKTALNTLKKLIKISHLKSITLTGGEPTLSERFIEIVLFCRLKGLDVTVISNGNYYTKDNYKLLLDMGVSLFEFPLLSYDEKVHDSLTRTDGSWNKTLKSIKDVLLLKGNVTGVIVITKENYKNIDKTLTLMFDLGIESIMLNRFNIGGEGIHQQKYILPTKEELHEAFSVANQFAQTNSVQLSSNVCTPWCVLNPKLYPNIFFVDCANSFQDKPITVDFEGNLRICNHSPKIIGNIHTHDLTKLLDNEYINSWESIIPDYCKPCSLFENCKGGCRGASEQMGFGIQEVDPIVSFFIK